MNGRGYYGGGWSGGNNNYGQSMNSPRYNSGNNNWQSNNGNQWQQNSNYNNSPSYANQGYAEQSPRGGRSVWPEQAAPQPVRTPVRRAVNNPQQTSRQAPPNPRVVTRQPQYPQPISDDETEYFSSGIRPATGAKGSVKRVPTTSSFSSAETALCLVPQTPHITEITRLLKGDKGDQGQAGDSFFENTGDEVKLNRGRDLVIPGNLKVATLEVANLKGPVILCGGEGITGEEGNLTIQLSREVKGQWTKDNAKILFTPRQSCSGLFLPVEGLEPEHNQFTVHCSDKQRIAFDWVMIRL